MSLALVMDLAQGLIFYGGGRGVGWTERAALTSRHLRARACSVTQACLTLCDPMDCSPPGSSVHGIFQARILEWVAISSSRGSSRPRDRTQISYVSLALVAGSLPLAPPGNRQNHVLHECIIFFRGQASFQ